MKIEHANSMRVAVATLRSRQGVEGADVRCYAPGAYPCGVGFDLIIVRDGIERTHEEWLNDALLCRLMPTGRVVFVGVA